MAGRAAHSRGRWLCLSFHSHGLRAGPPARRRSSGARLQSYPGDLAPAGRRVGGRPRATRPGAPDGKYCMTWMHNSTSVPPGRRGWRLVHDMDAQVDKRPPGRPGWRLVRAMDAQLDKAIPPAPAADAGDQNRSGPEGPALWEGAEDGGQVVDNVAVHAHRRRGV